MFSPSSFISPFLNSSSIPKTSARSPVLKKRCVPVASLAETKFTGSLIVLLKTPIENIQELSVNKKNIQKQTLQSEDFYQLVKSKIEMTKGKIKLSNQ